MIQQPSQNIPRKKKRCCLCQRSFLEGETIFTQLRSSSIGKCAREDICSFCEKKQTNKTPPVWTSTYPSLKSGRLSQQEYKQALLRLLYLQINNTNNEKNNEQARLYLLILLLERMKLARKKSMDPTTKELTYEVDGIGSIRVQGELNNSKAFFLSYEELKKEFEQLFE